MAANDPQLVRITLMCPLLPHGVPKELDMTEQLNNKTTLYQEFGVTWPGSSGSVSPEVAVTLSLACGYNIHS